jgi:pyrroloquinoline-quinone synthase
MSEALAAAPEFFAASEFFAALDARIARYDLLQHPFYQAWSKGELTRDELREYASEYWHHVSAFPTYLSALHAHLEDAPLRRTVLENLADEEGLPAGRAHSDLWMDFAAGMGAHSAGDGGAHCPLSQCDAGFAGLGAGLALHL